MFFLRSLIFTFFSPKFYREAISKGAKKAFGVYSLFILLTSIIFGVYFAITMTIAIVEMPQGLEGFPDIVIENGELSADIEMPAVYVEKGSYFGLDTTGEITEIPKGYSQALLFTKTEMMFRSKDQYGDQKVSYQEMFEDSGWDRIEINKELIAQYFQIGAVILMCIVPILLFFIRYIWFLLGILIITLIGYAVLSIRKHDKAFEKAFVISTYAFIPVYIVGQVMGWIEGGIASLTDGFYLSSICCLIPLIIWAIKWTVFWGLGMFSIDKVRIQ